MSKNDIARPKVILDGKQAEEELDKLTQKANKYRDAMLAAASVGDNKAQKEAAANFKKATAEVNSFKREALSVEAVLKNINGASVNELSQAYRKANAELRKMKQSDPGYADQQKNVSLLKNKLGELGKQSGVNISVWEKLKNTASGLLPAFGFAAIAAGAKIAFDKVVGSTDFLSTKWEIFMGGMKSGTDEFFRTIATGDWSNFLSNLREAVRVGREYAEAMDSIEEKTRALRITEADLRAKELELEEKLKNKGLSKAERLNAGQERIKLEEDLSKKRVKVAKDAFDAELSVTMQQTRLSKERLMEVVSDMDSETKAKAQAYNDQLDIFESSVKKNEQAKAGLSRAGISDNPFTKEVENSKAILDSYPDSVKVYAEALRSVGSTTDEQLNKMVSAYEGLMAAQNSSAENTKRVRTTVNSLLAGKEEDGTKLEDQATKEDMNNATKALDLGYKQQLLLLKQRYESEETIQKEYKARMLAAEIAYMQTKMQLTSDEEAKIDLQSQLIGKQREFTEALKETVPEILKTDNGIKNLNARLLEESKLLAFAAQKQAQGTAAQETAIAKQKQQSDTIKMVGDVMTDYVTGALNGSLDGFQSFGDTLILMSLQILKQMVPIWSAQILGLSLASPESIATWGVAGMAKFAVITGLMYAGIAAVEGLVKKKKQDSTTKYAAGGFTNGEGVYIAGEEGKEWIAPNWMVTHPATAPLISDLDKFRETGIAVDLTNLGKQNGTIAAPNTRAINKAMISQNYGLANGGYPVVKQSKGLENSASPNFNILIDVANRFNESINRLEQMDLTVHFSEFDNINKRRALRERQSKL